MRKLVLNYARSSRTHPLRIKYEQFEFYNIFAEGLVGYLFYITVSS
jgi:hypothetical protein